MEEFTLEKYETGEYDVITRNGRNARIICTDRINDNGSHPIVALVRYVTGVEGMQPYTTGGRYYDDTRTSEYDLFLVKKRWKPADGEKYYRIWFANFSVQEHNFDDILFDNNNYEIGNCFRTKEEAEETAEKIKELLKNHN